MNTFGKIKELMLEMEKVGRFKGMEYWDQYLEQSGTSVVDDDLAHTRRLRQMARKFKKDLEQVGVDFGRLMSMLAVHDLPEIITGDESPFDPSTDKAEKEIAALGQILQEAGADETETAKWIGLMSEYQERESITAINAKMLDLLDGDETACTVLEEQRWIFTEHKNFSIQRLQAALRQKIPESIQAEAHALIERFDAILDIPYTGYSDGLAAAE